jgi:hypothetical protein
MCALPGGARGGGAMHPFARFRAMCCCWPPASQDVVRALVEAGLGLDVIVAHTMGVALDEPALLAKYGARLSLTHPLFDGCSCTSLGCGSYSVTGSSMFK